MERKGRRRLRWRALLVALVVGSTALVVVPERAAPVRVAEICRDGVCDGQVDPANAREDKLLQRVILGPDSIELHVSFVDGGMAWADLRNGQPGEPVWLDRTFDGGATWEEHLGITSVPEGQTGWRTQLYWVSDAARAGMVRACAKVNGFDEPGCTAWLPVCHDGTCDGADPAGVTERSVNPNAWVANRKVTLHVAADSRTAWAGIENGVAGDLVWIDRSWAVGEGHDGPLVGTAIPAGTTGWRTWRVNFDDPAHGGTGSLRACGRAVDGGEDACTPWVRATEQPPLLHRAAVDRLMLDYKPDRGLWGPGEPEASIWLSPNALTALIDYMAATGDRRYESTIAQILERHPSGIPAKTIADYYDDFAWWALAWVRAYDLTGNRKYLDKADDIAKVIRGQWTDACGGGIRWQAGDKVKTTITNALYMKLAASLARRGRGGDWLREARKVLDWFGQGGSMLYHQPSRLMRDAIVEVSPGTCVYKDIVGDKTYTYLQGAMVGGLTEFYRAGGDPLLLIPAIAIANATMTNPELVPRNGVLHYGPEEGDDGLKNVKDRYPSDGTAFKGATVRNLREFYNVLTGIGVPATDLRDFLRRQTASIVANDRHGWAEFGLHWTGPIRSGYYITFASQASAVDAFNAAYGL
jgi:predicted alpha-1,6-mannanase (GH76 family)